MASVPWDAIFFLFSACSLWSGPRLLDGNSLLLRPFVNFFFFFSLTRGCPSFYYCARFSSPLGPRMAKRSQSPSLLFNSKTLASLVAFGVSLWPRLPLPISAAGRDSRREDLSVQFVFTLFPRLQLLTPFFLSVTHDLTNDCCFWKKAQRIFELMSKCGITPVFTDNSRMRREE